MKKVKHMEQMEHTEHTEQIDQTKKIPMRENKINQYNISSGQHVLKMKN